MKPILKAAALTAATVTAVSLLAGCSSTSSSTSNGPVHLTVGALQPGASDAAKKALVTQITQFEKANPNIKVKAVDYNWTGPTFAAQLAGGTLPDVFNVPFTDSKALANAGQIADITKEFDGLSVAKKFNPKVLQVAKADNGDVYGVPYTPYAMALSYNRQIFSQAGLDPNKPPTTWAEVEADAKQISSKLPGVAGYMQMTQDNTGGWELAADTYSLGGRLETRGKNGKYTVDADNPHTKQALEWLQKLRWKDNAMGSNFLYNWDGINQAFGAGKIAMYMSGSDVLTALVQNDKVDPKNYGVAALPVDTSNPNAGVLSGGNVAVVSPKDAGAKIAAAVKWINFYYVQPYTQKAAAVSNAKTLAASHQVVGAPELPVYDQATYKQQQTWIKPYVNIPLQNVAPFTNRIFSQNVVPEPEAHSQDLYGALDSVVQSVLTQQNVNIDQLLKGVDSKIQPLVDSTKQ